MNFPRNIKGELVCQYCARPYPTSVESYAENPFCSACLNERIRVAAKDACNSTTAVGDYLVFCNRHKGHDGEHANAFVGKTWLTRPRSTEWVGA